MRRFPRRLVVLLALALACALPGQARALDMQFSRIPGNVPAAVADDTLAINRADGKLFYRRGDGSLGASTLLNALPSGRRAVEQGQSDDQTVAGRVLSSFISGAGGKTTLTPDAITTPGTVSAGTLDGSLTQSAFASGAARLPTCTSGSATAPVPAGQPFVCGGLVLMAQ